ncbi:MAG: hypothetical protein HQ485_11935 [Acidobacteria bacterium]|nr:hypothetical protein [Acidobacteriota bacterium]
MRRRDFLKSAAAAAALAAAHPLGRRLQARTAGRHYVWMRPSLTRTDDEWSRQFEQLKTAGITGIIPEVYNGSSALWGSNRLPVRAPWLERILPIATRAGLEVHAWMWCMPCLLPNVMRDHPDWYNVNAKGESAVDKPAYVGYYTFLDPAHPDVRAFVRDTVLELATLPGLTGIHLDYIRHPDAILPSDLWAKYGIVQDKVYPPYDYGYTTISRNAFQAAHGVDPITLPDPESNKAWLAYRLQTVVDLVNDYLVPAAKSGGKQISAAVFPGPSLARTMVRQDWGQFNLDAFFPMLYHTFYQAGPEWVKQYTEEAVRTVTAPVHSGLFVGPLSAADLSRTITMALDGGAAGVSLFDLGAMNDDRWTVFAKAVNQ